MRRCGNTGLPLGSLVPCSCQRTIRVGHAFELHSPLGASVFARLTEGDESPPAAGATIPSSPSPHQLGRGRGHSKLSEAVGGAAESEWVMACFTGIPDALLKVGTQTWVTYGRWYVPEVQKGCLPWLKDAYPG